RNDRPPEFGFVNPHEVHEGLAEIGILFEQAKNRTRLRHGFNRQYSGHDLGTREMAIKEWFVNSDVLERDDAFILVNFENPIDQEKRVSMRQDPHDFSNAQFHA